MHVSTEIGDRREFVLTKAVLIYEDQVHKREKFATVHNVIREAANQQRPQLGPGSLLTTAFLKRLSAGLDRAAKAVLLPESVLAYTSELLIWWTPPRLHPMYFSDGTEDRTLVNGSVCPHPALVWKVHRGHLSLRALLQSVRPTAGTAL